MRGNRPLLTIACYAFVLVSVAMVFGQLRSVSAQSTTTGTQPSPNSRKGACCSSKLTGRTRVAG